MCKKFVEEVARSVGLSMINSELEGTKTMRAKYAKDGRVKELKYWDDSIKYLESIKEKY